MALIGKETNGLLRGVVVGFQVRADERRTGVDDLINLSFPQLCCDRVKPGYPLGLSGGPPKQPPGSDIRRHDTNPRSGWRGESAE